MAYSSAAEGGAAAGWSARGLAIVGLCFAINMADGIDVTMLSYIAPRLQAEWGMGSAEMGRLFGAGLAGMAIGGMGIAPLADRFGRRIVIILALLLMSLGMLLSGFAPGPAVLLGLRVVVGAGIGTVLAAMAALAAEAAPAAQRNLAVGLVQAGYPFAAIFTGLIAAAALPAHGWRVLVIGAGLVSLVFLPAALVLLPQVRRPAPGTPGRVSALFAARYRASTAALWLAVFSGLMVLYFIVSWIPRLAIAAGLSETNGIYAGALYNCGAFAGTALMSLAALRLPLGRLVPAMLIGAGAAMLAFGSTHPGIAATLLLAFLIGVLLQGGYNGIWPLAAAAYPEEIRATGVGWAIGVGRAGAIIGPWAGGLLMAAQVSLPGLFAAYCLPLVLCAGAAWVVENRELTCHTLLTGSSS
ncbi:MAG: MFS transporter [Sphingomonadales bacterium]|nr:MFS transporter [Sphingomonadales bacterium]